MKRCAEYGHTWNTLSSTGTLVISNYKTYGEMKCRICGKLGLMKGAGGGRPTKEKMFETMFSMAEKIVEDKKRGKDVAYKIWKAQMLGGYLKIKQLTEAK